MADVTSTYVPQQSIVRCKRCRTPVILPAVFAPEPEVVTKIEIRTVTVVEEKRVDDGWGPIWFSVGISLGMAMGGVLHHVASPSATHAVARDAGTDINR